MGLFDWFKSRSPGGPKSIGRSIGGSDVLKYGGNEFGNSPIGVQDQQTEVLVARRETAFEEALGKCQTVFHEVVPFLPHVDVFFYPPTDERPFATYLTSGMSNLPMTVPPKARDRSRVELVFYSDSEVMDGVVAELLRRLAHFPHDNHTWLGHGHTMQNGSPPAPIFEGLPFDAFFFSDTIVRRPDAQIQPLIDGVPLNLLWLVPITPGESELKLSQGSDAMLDLLGARKHPFVFSFKNPRRPYV